MHCQSERIVAQFMNWAYARQLRMYHGQGTCVGITTYAQLVECHICSSSSNWHKATIVNKSNTFGDQAQIGPLHINAGVSPGAAFEHPVECLTGNTHHHNAPNLTIWNI